jgi:hypothetical protein
MKSKKKICGIRDLASLLRLEDLQPWRLSKQRKKKIIITNKKKPSASSCRGRGGLEGLRNRRGSQ